MLKRIMLLLLVVSFCLSQAGAGYALRQEGAEGEGAKSVGETLAAAVGGVHSVNEALKILRGNLRDHVIVFPTITIKVDNNYQTMPYNGNECLFVDYKEHNRKYNKEQVSILEKLLAKVSGSDYVNLSYDFSHGELSGSIVYVFVTPAEPPSFTAEELNELISAPPYVTGITEEFAPANAVFVPFYRGRANDIDINADASRLAVSLLEPGEVGDLAIRYTQKLRLHDRSEEPDLAERVIQRAIERFNEGFKNSAFANAPRSQGSTTGSILYIGKEDDGAALALAILLSRVSGLPMVIIAEDEEVKLEIMRVMPKGFDENNIIVEGGFEVAVLPDAVKRLKQIDVDGNINSARFYSNKSLGNFDFADRRVKVESVMINKETLTAIRLSEELSSLGIVGFTGSESERDSIFKAYQKARRLGMATHV